MYNLLVTSQQGAWDNTFYEFDKSRFLEYTNEKLATKFQSLTERKIADLKALPCIFAYEGTEESVRIGYLTAIKVRARTLLIEYEFHPKIERIPYALIKPIAPLLDIRGWEMSRTHWAIKDENLFERLRARRLIPSDVIGLVEKPEVIPSDTESKTPTSTISTLRGFVDKVLVEKGSDTEEVFYRGHSDKKKYKLEPSLFRKDERGNYLYLQNEHILYRELIVSNSIDFATDEYTLDRLVRMQHYSLPTRLLDITSNPLIALYFACKSKSDVEGEVVIFSLNREQIKYFDSDVASCISNLVRLPKDDKDKIDFTLTSEEFNEQLPIKRLTHFIKEEKSFFEPRIVPDHLRKIICVKGKKSNARISSQSGAFLLFGLDSVLDENGTNDIRVTRVSVANKRAILKQLDVLNINESTVFPYIENSARYIAEKYAVNNSS